MAEIKNRGHEVIFCAAHDDYTTRLEKMSFRYIPVVLERKGKNIFKEISLLFSLIMIYRSEKPDWIFHNSVKPNIYGAIAAHFTGRRCVNTVSGLGYLFIRKSLLTDISTVFYRLAGIYAEKTFFQNKDDLRFFLDHRLINAGKYALVAGSGINTDFFKPAVNRRTFSPKDDFIFLYLGRLLWDKGVEEIIESVRILKKHYPLLRVNFLGMIDEGNPSGIDAPQIKKWEQEGIIRYLGEVADVRPYLEGCGCVILPSFYREGVPKALLEAAAMELPVITTNVPGCRDAVEHGITGLLVEARDTHALVEAMDSIIKMKEDQRREMGRRGREKVIREYSEKVVIETYCSQIGL